MKPAFDHAGYPKRLKRKTEAELRFIIADCKKSIDAMPDGENNPYYYDEMHYCHAELNRRADVFIIKSKKKPVVLVKNEMERGERVVAVIDSRGCKFYYPHPEAMEKNFDSEDERAILIEGLFQSGYNRI